ncbi:MAG: CPBP family intramembrane glutamic endopeptidase [Pseudomonadota bacterium]
MDILASLILWNGVAIALIGVAAVCARQPVAWRWVFAAFSLFNVNVCLVLNVFGLNGLIYNLLGNPELSFNWAGKIIALMFSLTLLMTGIVRWHQIGGVFKQSKGAVMGWSVVGLLCVVGVGLALVLPDEPHSLETIAYQLTMPSLEEEIFYRGIFLYCLVRAFGEGPRIAASNFGSAAIISTLMFTIIHALLWDEKGLFFQLDAFLFAGVFGVLLTWLRLNTGSLLAPILMHSAVNTIWRLL